jgi:hypothetical protein
MGQACGIFPAHGAMSAMQMNVIAERAVPGIHTLSAINLFLFCFMNI